MLGLGYPGGPAIEKMASKGELGRFSFPVTAFRDGTLDFSFSGVKTALLYLLYGQGGSRQAELRVAQSDLPDIVAAYQDAVTEALVSKLLQLALDRGLRTVIAGGGVSANGVFRAKLEERSRKNGLRLVLAPRNLCTDNAAMVAGLGFQMLREGRASPLDIDAFARSPRAGSRKA
jgi:N6-L-threonylcarbamoyladenine synthase